MKSLQQKLAESEAKLENLSNTKLVDNRFVFVPFPVLVKPKEKIYIPPFKWNYKEKAYFARLNKGKSSDVDAEVSKPKSRPTIREHNKSIFVPVCHFCGVPSHIRPNCHKLKFKYSMFQSKICDDISLAISPYKLFHILLKNLSLLACERNLQDLNLSQKIGVIP